MHSTFYYRAETNVNLVLNGKASEYSMPFYYKNA